MSKLRVTELDFLQIRDNLKDFLRSQDEFKDYDFEGSGLAVLLDILAYNTHYNAFYLNQVASEMFLDSATLRESVVSRAKHITYTPRSSRAAQAKLQIQFFPTTSPASITIPYDTEFNTNIDGSTYIFRTNESYIVEPNTSGEYIAEEVEIIEGKRVTQTFVVDNSEPQRFLLDNNRIDTTTIKVNVKKSLTNTTQTAYVLNEDINVLDGESTVYFLQEVEDEKFEIYFGDGFVGRALQDGEVVIVEYLVTNGAAANTANLFSPIRKIAGFNGTTITTTQPAYGGDTLESIASIKHLAPLNYEAQDRAVTKNDYETLIKTDFPNIEAVRVWGGEDNDPQQFGRVFISLKPITGVVLSTRTKQIITNRIVTSRSIVALEPVLVDPDFTTIAINTKVIYKSANTTKPESDLRNEILSNILVFGDENLDKFDNHFRYSALTRVIDDTDVSIINNLTTIRLKKEFSPVLNVPTQFELQFNNQLDKGDACNGVYSLSSTAFTIRGFTAYFTDDGLGCVHIFRFVGTERRTLIENIGTIDYDTGKVTINKFAPEALPDGVTTVELFVTPAENDIYPLRNQILIFEEEDVKITMSDESNPSLDI